MNAGTFHQFHDTGHEDVSAVTDGVDLNLLAGDVFVDQHRLVFVNFHSRFQIVAQLLLIGNDLHCATAEHKRRTHQNGIADPCGSGNTVFNLRHCLTFRLRNIELFKQLFKQIAVFGAVNGCAVGADDFNAALHER